MDWTPLFRLLRLPVLVAWVCTRPYASGAGWMTAKNWNEQRWTS